MDAQIKRVLAHPRRAEILSYLIQKMGANAHDAGEAELADALGLDMSLVKYHLTILCRANMISHMGDSKQGTLRRYIAAAPAGE
jgi:DNA-binding transcriptional ArsR family regulator